jgi:hypothetical protein
MKQRQHEIFDTLLFAPKLLDSVRNSGFRLVGDRSERNRVWTCEQCYGCLESHRIVMRRCVKGLNRTSVQPCSIVCSSGYNRQLVVLDKFIGKRAAFVWPTRLDLPTSGDDERHANNCKRYTLCGSLREYPCTMPQPAVGSSWLEGLDVNFTALEGSLSCWCGKHTPSSKIKSKE